MFYTVPDELHDILLQNNNASTGNLLSFNFVHEEMLQNALFRYTTKTAYGRSTALSERLLGEPLRASDMKRP